MIPGLQNDDKWRMVEDEFAVVAHKFTAHLHATEYRRLKERAKNSAAMRSISRPVKGPMTANVKRRQTALNLKKSQDRGIKENFSRTKGTDDDDVEELPWVGTNLQELMNSPRKKAVPLTSMISIVSNTRAAALNRQDSSSKSQNGQSPLGTSKAVRHSASSPSLHSTSWDQAPARATAAIAKQSASTPTTSIEDHDSDSPVESFFDRRLKERRAQRQVSRRDRHSTPQTAEHRPNRKKTSLASDALSIPLV